MKLDEAVRLLDAMADEAKQGGYLEYEATEHMADILEYAADLLREMKGEKSDEL